MILNPCSSHYLVIFFKKTDLFVNDTIMGDYFVIMCIYLRMIKVFLENISLDEFN